MKLIEFRGNPSIHNNMNMYPDFVILFTRSVKYIISMGCSLTLRSSFPIWHFVLIIHIDLNH